MTEAQKSFKKKLENSGLHIEEIGGVPILKDGQGRVISGGGGSATWGSIGGTLSNQTDLKNALAGKADVTAIENKLNKLPLETFSHQEYQFPFNINPLVQESDRISTSFDTLVLNDGITRAHYPMEIKAADPSNNKAGLLTKALYDQKSKVTVSDTGTATDVVKYITVDDVEKKIGVDIIDDLTSTDIDKPLSANQGKQLNDTKQSKITSGTADPSGGNDGDVYIKISA